MGYLAAVAELYQASLEEFGKTRKRLAAELAAKGDAKGSTALAKLPRPSLSAWIVNQLWWTTRKPFDVMLETGARLHAGHTGAGPMYSKAVAKLREAAEALLADTDDPEPTLRRVTTTLAALASAGGFGPDRAGTLSEDREPGGFEAIGEVTVSAARAPSRADEDLDAPAPPPMPRASRPKPPTITKHANGRVHPHVEFHEDDHTLQLTERKLLEGALRTARQTIATSETEAAKLRARLDELEHAISQARVIVADVEARLGTGDD